MISEPNIAIQSGIVRIDIADKQELYAAYMPFITNGGLFVTQDTLGTARYDMGSDVFLLLHLVDQDARLPVAGKVIWLTPRGGGAQRPAGIGIQFAQQDNGNTQRQIETLLAGMLDGNKPTYTL